MSRTPAFGRLQRLAAIARFARRQGITEAGPARAAFDLSRRDFVRAGAVALAAAGPLAACGRRVEGSVGVIGAGIAGLHCAYRLHQAGVEVTVYEAADRTGGRMFTGRGLFPEDQLCELGGELIDTNHEVLWALAEELGLQIDDRLAEDGPDTLLELFWIEGSAVSEEVLLEQLMATQPAFEDAYEGAETDDDTYTELDLLDMRAWLELHVPLDQYPELHQVLAVAYRGEFGLEIEEQSSLNLIYLFGFSDPDTFKVFGDSDERYHTHEGNDAFTSALAAPLTDEGLVLLEHTLTRVAEDAEGRFVLTLSDADGATVEAVHDHVVFALPFTTLRKVDLSGVSLSAAKAELIDTLSYGTNAKIMGAFSSRVWRTVYDQSGTMTHDGRVQQTWSSSIGQQGTHGVLTDFTGGRLGVECGEGTAEEWMQGVLPELEEVWPGAAAAYVPDSAVRMHWPTYAHALGSYTCYTPGQWQTWGLEGVREGQLHFCGEHCSADFQGWMEGAAETGGLVAAEILDDMGLSRPAGLQAAIGGRLAMPQPCYHGHLNPRQNPFARRRAWARLRRGP